MNQSAQPLFMSISVVALLTASGCGYLDEELWIDDEEFHAGIGAHGYGSSGCGGASGIFNLEPMSFHVRMGGQRAPDILSLEGGVSTTPHLDLPAEHQSHRSAGEPAYLTQPKGSGWVRHFVDVQMRREESIREHTGRETFQTTDANAETRAKTSTDPTSGSEVQRIWSRRPS
jgi:hypothetical protein